MEVLINLAYLAASAKFIIALKRLSSPRTARSGNLIGASGMLLGIIATLLDRSIVSFEWILLGVVLGSALGAGMALTVRMTAMPQMVALLNGFGGAASALVAVAEMERLQLHHGIGQASGVLLGTIEASVVIGTVTFTGSLIAFAKLQELITGRPIVLPFHHGWNALQAAAIVVLAVLILLQQTTWAESTLAGLFYALLAISAVLGIMLVIPIGGADMPVVISFLNSLSGLAAASTGFVLHNYLLIIAGTLVGASGFILTNIMCMAMNRSLLNVLFGAFGAEVVQGAATDRVVRTTTAEDAAVIMGYARSVVIVPGYGMAVAQAQHAVKKLATLLQQRGIDVKFAIHPVAGRMPGHMNVLLAEADVPYDLLYDMERINPEFEHTDVALVVGANDVVNPAARKDPTSPLYGMPILDVDRARTVIVLKRSMNPGFAGVENELFYQPNTYMLFGDARRSLEAVAEALKSV
nr:NAD(P)(+) transhydrogenase (Re/Si-specific) subunit beta [Candidatus Kapabacteria bacterium]MDW8011800.1 NAD(P)(+) transhydrogenase (Re/Si-specific) subunit beta [Bacteroidota bacterium]